MSYGTIFLIFVFAFTVAGFLFLFARELDEPWFDIVMFGGGGIFVMALWVVLEKLN